MYRKKKYIIYRLILVKGFKKMLCYELKTLELAKRKNSTVFRG